MNNPKQAFISHSSPDDRYVAEFVQLVRSLGFTEVFNDSHTIEPDALFWDRIERGIRECDAFVVILSQASVKSYWVDKEVQFARGQGKRIIPIRIDNCLLPSGFDGRDVIELKHAGKMQLLSPPRFIHHAAEHFLGREPQLALLDKAWADDTNVLSIIAWGGVGKSALITEWVQSRFIEKHWRTDNGQPALDAYFDWTFYDQGTRALADGTEARTGSVGDFFEQALVFFGDPDPNLPGKGRRLADLIRQQRSLIILDGLEPLQQPPGHPQAGRLLDPDLRDLLAALAQSNPGLCLITSRQALTDLHSLRRTVHKEEPLKDLPVAIAIRLLRQLQIKGTDQELAEASEKFGCHALSLTLLGRYLFDAHGGDIARTDRIRDLQRADTLTREDRHRTAWRVLETYESWLATAQADGNPKTLAVLRLTGLFDRTATADCLAALRAEPIIPGLTDAICGMADDEWNILLKRLERTHLIKLRESSNLKSPISDSGWAVDAHPLIREYFGKWLKETQADSFRAAHSRLFDHLCRIARRQPDTLMEMQPLYQAIAHGCEAHRRRNALDVYIERILRNTRNDGYFSWKYLPSSTSSEIRAIASFFQEPWNTVWPIFRDSSVETWLLCAANYVLRDAVRLTEAVEPLSKAFHLYDDSGEYANATVAANNLSELSLLLGRLSDAIHFAESALKLAEFGDSSTIKIGRMTTLGEVLHQSGQQEKAIALFVRAEALQAATDPELPLPIANWGHRYAALLLSPAERAAWVSIAGRHTPSSVATSQAAISVCDEAMRRPQMGILTRRPNDSLLDAASDELALTKATLFSALVAEGCGCPENQHKIGQMAERMITAFRDCNSSHELPNALLTAAFYHGTLGENLEEAERLLEEAQ